MTSSPRSHRRSRGCWHRCLQHVVAGTDPGDRRWGWELEEAAQLIRSPRRRFSMPLNINDNFDGATLAWLQRDDGHRRHLTYTLLQWTSADHRGHGRSRLAPDQRRATDLLDVDQLIIADPVPRGDRGRFAMAEFFHFPRRRMSGFRNEVALGRSASRQSRAWNSSLRNWSPLASPAQRTHDRAQP